MLSGRKDAKKNFIRCESICVLCIFSASLRLNYNFTLCLMCIIKQPAAIIWAASALSIQNPKCWCGNFYMPMAFVIHSTIKNFPANQTLFYPNTKPSSLFMVASGTDMQTENTLLYPKREPSGGPINFLSTKSMMKKLWGLWEKMDGK